MKLKPINQQVVVVVGCTSGIGLEAARQFARQGAMLVLAGRGQADLDATLAAVREEGSDGITVEADVADREQVNNIAQRAVDSYGRIDTWAHIAGVPLYSKVEETNPDDFRRVLEVNLHGPMYGIQAALPHLKREGRGALIIVSSVDSVVPVPYQGPYVASKAGLKGLIDTLRVELKHDGYPISVTSIRPTTISTPFFEKAKTNLGFEPDLMPPIYSAKSVADAIVYAASHPVRNLNVGSGSTIFQVSRRVSPRMNDAILRRVAFKAQESDIVKGAEAPNNLYQHIEGYNRVEGKKPGMYSKSIWLETHPAAKWALRGSLLASLPIGTAFYLRSRRKKMSLPKRASRTVSNLLSDLTSAGIIAGLISHFKPQKPSLQQRISQGARGAVETVSNRVSKTRERLPDAQEALQSARGTLHHLRESMPSLPHRRQSTPEKLISKFQAMIDDSVPSMPRRRQSMPEKLLSKVQDIMPKGLIPQRQSMPERAMERIKEVEPKKFLRREPGSVPDRLAKRVQDVQECLAEREDFRA